MSGNTVIDTNEIDRHQSYDPMGYVFRWRDKVYRAIYPRYEDTILSLWKTGLVPNLIELGLFPESQITKYRSTDSNLIIEHQRIEVISYPHEWSFNMLKDAALMTLRVNQIARQYGYQTIDAHGFNIAFIKGRAQFIDLGSFDSLNNHFNCSHPGWRPYGQFMRSFHAPLKMWSQGDEYFSRHSLYGEQMPLTSYWRYRSKLARLVPRRALSRLEFAWHKYKALNTVPMSKFEQATSVSGKREKLGRGVVSFSKRWGLPFSSVNLERLERKVSRIKSPRIPSKWGTYHSNMPVDDRQRYVIETIARLKPQSVLDIAGNAGLFSKKIAEVDHVQYVICADYDTNAIDQLHLSLRGTEHRIYPVVMDYSISVGDSKFPTATERFKADMVIALALTHHLLLTQNLTIEFVLSRLKSFARQYVAVEFMPLGLYSSKFNKKPTLPEWYHVEPFRKQFSRTFSLLDEKTIDNNRIIFVGEVDS